MTVITKEDAQQQLDALIQQTAIEHSPVLITSMPTNAVLLSEEDWNSIQETLYLFSIPGMRESIEEGLRTDIKDCSTDPGW